MHIRGSECDQKILSKRESTGLVYSPNYPFPYLPKTVCRYVAYNQWLFISCFAFSLSLHLYLGFFCLPMHKSQFKIFFPHFHFRYFVYGLQDAQHLERVRLEFQMFEIQKGDHKDKDKEYERKKN